MKHRWIIRSFFVGLLLLFVGGWVGSYKYSPPGYRSISPQWQWNCFGGRIALCWDKRNFRPRDPAEVYRGELPFIDPKGYELLGFDLRYSDWGKGLRSFYLAIPLWFPTLLSAALLWLVWRKTRPKVKGRAFPVELGKSGGEEGGKEA